MGAAALRHVHSMVMEGSRGQDALGMVVGSMVFDCLVSVLPNDVCEGRQSYVVNRVARVLDALDGKGWSLLTDREIDVALCVRSAIGNPDAWLADEWERGLSDVIERYRIAAGMGNTSYVM